MKPLTSLLENLAKPKLRFSNVRYSGIWYSLICNIITKSEKLPTQ